MASVDSKVDSDLENVLLTPRELWREGPPHELFASLRRECPVHRTERFIEFPEEPGFWSVTTAEDVLAVSRDWRTFSSERGGVTADASIEFPNGFCSVPHRGFS